MTNRIILRAAAWISLALIMATVSIASRLDTRFISTTSSLSFAHPLNLALLSSSGELKHRIPAVVYLASISIDAPRLQLAIGETLLRSGSFIVRLLAKTSISDRAPPLV